MAKSIYVVVRGTIITRPDCDREEKSMYVSRVFDVEENAEKYIREQMIDMRTNMERGLCLTTGLSSFRQNNTPYYAIKTKE